MMAYESVEIWVTLSVCDFVDFDESSKVTLSRYEAQDEI